MLPPVKYPSIPPDDDEESRVQTSAQKDKIMEDKVRTKLLRFFLVGYKNADHLCRYCPKHPSAACKWNSTKGYFYLGCSHSGCGVRSTSRCWGISIWISSLSIVTLTWRTLFLRIPRRCVPLKVRRRISHTGGRYECEGGDVADVGNRIRSREDVNNG